MRSKEARRPRPSRATVLVGAALVMAASGVALAQPNDDVVDACVAKNGALRVLADAATGCRSQETPLSWNRTGPAGPPGADGAPGSAGPPGPAGVSGWERVTETVDVEGLPRRQHIVSCPPGKEVLGGGATIQGAGTLGRIALRESLPLGDDAWIATASSIPEQDLDFSLTISVLCADVQ